MKKKKRTTIFGLLALLVVGLLFSTSLASAYRGDYTVKGPNYDEERYELIQNAFDNLDYNEWYELMTQDGRHPRIVDVITEDNFETFVKAHEAAVSGDLETASSLRAELGLNNGLGPKDGSGYKRGRQQHSRGQNFVDADNDGVCDNFGSGFGRQR